MKVETNRCPFGCILAMPHAHGNALVVEGRVLRQLNWLESFLWRNFWFEPREMREHRRAT